MKSIILLVSFLRDGGVVMQIYAIDHILFLSQKIPFVDPNHVRLRDGAMLVGA